MGAWSATGPPLLCSRILWGIIAPPQMWGPELAFLQQTATMARSMASSCTSSSPGKITASLADFIANIYVFKSCLFFLVLVLRDLQKYHLKVMSISKVAIFLQKHF